MTIRPVALTCGEPAGIGPEITLAAWETLRKSHPFFWIGDPAHLPDGASWQLIERPEQAADVFGDALPVLPLEFGSERTVGTLRPEHARGVIRSIELAVEFAQSGQASAICTNPINKKALKDGAGFSFPGHTEFLAHLGSDAKVVMMLAADELKVVPATIHIPLSEVPATLTTDVLETCIRVTHKAMQSDFGVHSPRLAIAGLNPHAGEGGAMGHEDEDLIAPVLDKLRTEGFNLNGPLPADTMFHRKAREGYDAAICMYHDQALIPLKTIGFHDGVNVTLGLPIIRTSPDHGTGFDIAGQGIANPSSMIAALKLAWTMARGQ